MKFDRKCIQPIDLCICDNSLDDFIKGKITAYANTINEIARDMNYMAMSKRYNDWPDPEYYEVLTYKLNSNGETMISRLGFGIELPSKVTRLNAIKNLLRKLGVRK